LKRAPLIIFAIGFLSRLIVRLAQGRNDFWRTGYHAYGRLVKSIALNHDYVVATNFGDKRAFWPPVYPLFLALFTQGDRWYLPAIIAQSAIGALTAVVIYFIGRHLFSNATAVVAGIITALYPYYVFHDAKVQDTALFTCLMALSVLLILKCTKLDSLLLWSMLGLVTGLALLTRAMIQPFVLAVLIWLGITRGRRALLATLVFAVTISPWLIRNYLQIGSAVFTTQTGRFVWDAHSDFTFRHYPVESIDTAEWDAYRHLSPEEQSQIQAMAEAPQSDYLQSKGIQYIRAHPILTVYHGILKLKTAFSWVLSPTDSWIKEIVYFASYFSVLIFGILGIIRSRQRWRDLFPIYFLFLNFIIVTVFFWSHTSHRTFLDCYFILFAVHAISDMKLGKTRPEDPLTAS